MQEAYEQTYVDREKVRGKEEERPTEDEGEIEKAHLGFWAGGDARQQVGLELAQVRYEGHRVCVALLQPPAHLRVASAAQRSTVQYRVYSTVQSYVATTSSVSTSSVSTNSVSTTAM